MKIQPRFIGFRVQPHRSFDWDGEIAQVGQVTRATGSQLCGQTVRYETRSDLMWDHDCGCVPVLNEQAQVVGMLTDRDIYMVLLNPVS